MQPIPIAIVSPRTSNQYRAKRTSSCMSSFRPSSYILCVCVCPASIGHRPHPLSIARIHWAMPASIEQFARLHGAIRPHPVFTVLQVGNARIPSSRALQVGNARIPHRRLRIYWALPASLMPQTKGIVHSRSQVCGHIVSGFLPASEMASNLW